MARGAQNARPRKSRRPRCSRSSRQSTALSGRAAVVETRCGFVAIVGAPNAGKSTLLNSLVGSKVSIVTPKVQTTRARVLAFAIEGAAQIVFVDTPGIFVNPKRRLERAMVAAAWAGASDADVSVVLIDASRGTMPDHDPDSMRIVEQLGGAGRTLLLALNKTDQT